MSGKRIRAGTRGAPARPGPVEGAGRPEGARVGVVMAGAVALVRQPELERLAWRRTIQHLVPDISDASLASSDSMRGKLR